MNSELDVAAPAAAELAPAEVECPPTSDESAVVRGAWTRDIEALCRALGAQQRAQFKSTDTEEK